MHDPRVITVTTVQQVVHEETYDIEVPAEWLGDAADLLDLVGTDRATFVTGDNIPVTERSLAAGYDLSLL